MGEEIKVWYDKEGDYLEVLFGKKAGFFKETEHDAAMEKVDEEGNIIGFSILQVSALEKQELFQSALKNTSPSSPSIIVRATLVYTCNGLRGCKKENRIIPGVAFSPSPLGGEGGCIHSNS